MPYIAQADRDVVDPHIQNLRKFIVEKAGTREDRRTRFYSLLRDAASTIVASSANGAAIRTYGKSGLRYPLVNNQHGLYVDIPREIERRFDVCKPSALSSESIFHQWWVETIHVQPFTYWQPRLLTDMTVAINAVASKDSSKDIQAAFVGVCNYSFSELSIDTFLDVFGEDFPDSELQYQVYFWLRMEEEFYRGVGGPYEDTAIAKNGDCRSFLRMLAVLEKRKNG